MIDNLLVDFPIFSIVNRDSIAIKTIFVLTVVMTTFTIIYLIKIYISNISELKIKNPVKFFILGTFFLLIAFLLVVVVEITITKIFHSISIKTVTIISGVIQIGSLGFLVFNVIKWLQFTPENIIKLLFIVTISLIISSTLILIYTISSLQRMDISLITPNRFTISSSIITFENLETFYSISYLLSFILMWIFSSILLNQYIKQPHKLRFWIIMFIPLIYFLGHSELVNITFSMLDITSPILYFQLLNIANSTSNLIGSILFGFSFWIISKNIEIILLKKYMKLFAVGIIIFFMSHQISPITVLYYPPFGLASTAFMGISSFIISLSLYSTALIISVDKTLQSKLTKSGSFLGNIGSAHMFHSINKKILKISEKIIDYNSNYNILAQDDVQNYMKLAIKEKEEMLKKVTNISMGYVREDRPFGKSLNEWIELWWKWCYHDIMKPSPIEDETGMLCSKGQINGSVWFLGGTFGGEVKRKCVIPFGKSIFFPILNDIISFATDPHLRTDIELYAYAKADLDLTKFLYLKIDGKDVTNLLIFRARSELFSITLPIYSSKNSENVFSSVSTKAVSDGYWVFLKPLSIGKHTIEFEGEKLEYDKIRKTTALNDVPKFKVKVLYEIDII